LPEFRQRAKQFTEALKDGAFDFLLSIAADVKSTDWHDPARHSLRRWLQRKAPVILPDSIPFSDNFQELLVEQLSVFVESFITFLPDVLRKLRVDEDEQRQLSKEHEHELDLEKFIIIISYVFEGRPKSAHQDFWDNRDGALMGFVEWASKRASTPLVMTFCEMLQSISEDEECATEAHNFLLDEGAQSSSKLRRTHSLTWNQIFKELTYFSSKIRDRPALPQSQTFRPGKPNNDLAEAEPEVAMMLESYLRLITRLCSESEAARNFLAHHSSFHISELLFQLASSSIDSRLRACAFTTLRSLLSQKTREAGEYMWAALDVWITGGYSPGSNLPKTSTPSPSGVSITSIMKALGSGFEEPNAFVDLLTALVVPYSDESGLRDSLPFPENLGASTRQPGIDPYVDFAVGNIFSNQAHELNDVIHIRLLHLTCLNFIATCLDTFNEDLVIFASQSNVVIDQAIKTSNLQNYVLLHPFARVMEWMFNENVMASLFVAIHQDPAEVARSAPDSPLVLCVLRGLHVITKILELQPTYLDIIKPVIRSQQNFRRVPVPNASFASFEDGVLNHLAIIPDLGRYCGTGHSELVVASLKLLEMLSASPKLAYPASTVLGRGSSRNKALAALDDDAETISKILLREMESDIDDNEGPQSSAYVIKLHILDFIISCLGTSPNQPTIAHLLLGFRCGNEGLSLDVDGPFSRGVSLFHAILSQALNSPIEDESGISSWLVSLNLKSFRVLKELWLSPISSLLTMTEMRANNSFFWMFMKEMNIQPGMTWDGVDLTNLSSSNSTPATCLFDFLYRRALKFQYFSAELRQVSRSHTPSLKQRMFETLLGSTTLDDGQKIDHANVFDFFDFMEPEFLGQAEPPQLSWFSDIDLYACLNDHNDPSSTYNISRIEELLLLRRAELTYGNRLENPQDAALVDAQGQELLEFYSEFNHIKGIEASRLRVLQAWVQLILVMIESGDFDGSTKTGFVIKALQTIMPRVENDLEIIPQAIELAKLAKSLVFSLDFKSDTFKKGNLGDAASDRLFHLFQVSLKAINTLGSQVTLKEHYYNIAYRYLSGMADVAGISGVHPRHSVQTIKSAGDRFIDTVCDDAHGGEPTCRIAALLVLGVLVKLGHSENSKYIIESLVRLNFTGILVDSISNMTNDLRETSIEGKHILRLPNNYMTKLLLDTDIQLSYCHAKLALLVQLSQTRFGAAAVLNAGLFHSIKQSEMFATDPDLGVGKLFQSSRHRVLTCPDIKGPGALSKHYDLLAALLRIICAAILSRGPQNQQTLEQGRRFLSDNRLAVLAVLKKSAGLGSSVNVSEESIDEVSESFLLLISITGFLDVCSSSPIILLELIFSSLRTRVSRRSNQRNRSQLLLKDPSMAWYRIR
jgi:nuclear pore complex protein Nup205